MTYVIARENQREARNRIEEVEARVAMTYAHLVRRIFVLADSQRHFAETNPSYTRQEALDRAKSIVEVILPLERACDDRQLFLQLNVRRMDALLKLLRTLDTLCAIIDIGDFRSQLRRSMSLAANESNAVIEILGVERQKTLEESFEIGMHWGESP